MARSQESRRRRSAPLAGGLGDLQDYARRPTRRARRSRKIDWTVTDDWPEDVPVIEAEVEVFEAWFGDVFDELFSTDD